MKNAKADKDGLFKEWREKNKSEWRLTGVNGSRVRVVPTPSSMGQGEDVKYA